MSTIIQRQRIAVQRVEAERLIIAVERAEAAYDEAFKARCRADAAEKWARARMVKAREMLDCRRKAVAR
jgi:hypothetical protein